MRPPAHAWAWQLALPWTHRTQVCLRPGCGWRRRRIARIWVYGRQGRVFQRYLRPPACGS